MKFKCHIIIKRKYVIRRNTMDVKNCKICKRLFNALSGQKICPTCLNKLEDKFKEVKEYIRENKNCTINEVSEQMEIPVHQIKQWIREERLTFSEDSVGGIECEKCGTFIRAGRYCAKCKNELLNALKPEKKIFENPKQIKTIDNKMRFLNKTNDF